MIHNNFYTGIKTNRIINYNYSIDEVTGMIVPKNGYNTIEIYTLPDNYSNLFIKEPIIGSDTMCVFYKYSQSGDLSVISKYSLVEYSQKVIPIPKNADRFALSYSVNNEKSLSMYTSSDFLYYINGCTPHYKNAVLQYKKENNEQFFMPELSGNISLHGSDFEKVLSFGYDNEILFLVARDEKAISINKFTLGACKIEYDLKKISLKITALSQYDNILKNYENSYDILKLALPIYSISTKVHPVFQIYTLGASTLVEFSTNSNNYWEKEVISVIDSDSEIKNYHFAFALTASEFFLKADSNIPNSQCTFAGILGKCSPEDSSTLEDKKMYNSDGQYYVEFQKLFTKGQDYNPSTPNYECTNLMTGEKYNMFFVSNNITYYTALFNVYLMVIKRASDNTIIASFADGRVCVFDDNSQYEDSNNIYIGLSSMEFISGLQGVVTSSNELLYNMYMRVLLGENHSITETVYKIPTNDITDSAPSYKYCVGIKDLGVFYCQAKTTNTPTKFGINDYQQYFTSDNLLVDREYSVPVPVSRSFWGNSSIWFSFFNSYLSEFKSYADSELLLKDAYKISDVINALLNKIDNKISHKATTEYSKFLYGIENPVDANIESYNLYITQKTNILKGNYDQPAQKLEISFKNIMDLLKKCFRCYWFVENNMLKIEHISFFMNGKDYNLSNEPQLDITKKSDRFNKKLYSYFQDNSEVDLDSLLHRYELTFSDNSTEAFGPFSIDILNAYVSDNIEEVNVEAATDVDYMHAYPNDFSEDGIALLDVQSMQVKHIDIQLLDYYGNTYTSTLQNGSLSIPYLVGLYMYDFDGTNIAFDLLPSNALAVKKTKHAMTQSIRIPMEAESLDLFKPIRTKLNGNIKDGIIDNISMNIDTDFSDVKLIYEINN